MDVYTYIDTCIYIYIYMYIYIYVYIFMYTHVYVYIYIYIHIHIYIHTHIGTMSGSQDFGLLLDGIVVHTCSPTRLMVWQPACGCWEGFFACACFGPCSSLVEGRLGDIDLGFRKDRGRSACLLLLWQPLPRAQMSSLYVYIYIYCIYVCTHIHVCLCVCIYIHIYIIYDTHTCIHMHIYIYIFKLSGSRFR